MRRFVDRPRPSLKNLRTLELYGDAVLEADDGRKQKLLQQTMTADPTFVYASRDLDELERRMKPLTLR